jgi:hypothetical protein
MCINVNLKSNLHCFHSRNVVSFLSLLFTIMLISACFVSVFSDVSFFFVRSI